jgi:hypothetical protein
LTKGVDLTTDKVRHPTRAAPSGASPNTDGAAAAALTWLTADSLLP